MEHFTITTNKRMAILRAATLSEAAQIAGGHGSRGEAFNRHLAAHGYTVIQTDPSTLAEPERFECAVIDDWARCELAGIIGQFDKEHFVAWTSGDFYAGRAIRPLSPKFRTKPKYRLC